MTPQQFCRDISELKMRAKAIRKHIIRMITKAGSGHPGGSLSATDLIVALYYGK
jgi:transketolase